MIEEYTDGPDPDALARRYVYGSYVDDVIVMEILSGQANPGEHYYVKDSRFSVVALTNSSGVVKEGYRSTAFGRTIVYDDNCSTTDTSGTDFGNPYGFTGRRWDAERRVAGGMANPNRCRRRR